MNLAEAIDTLQNHDFQGADPDVLLALSVVIQSAQTRERGTNSSDAPNRQIDTSTD